MVQNSSDGSRKLQTLDALPSHSSECANICVSFRVHGSIILSIALISIQVVTFIITTNKTKKKTIRNLNGNFLKEKGTGYKAFRSRFTIKECLHLYSLKLN